LICPNVSWGLSVVTGPGAVALLIMEDAFVMGLAELALNKWTLFVAGGIFFLARALDDAPFLAQNPVTRRLLPFVPEALGIAAAFAGGLPVVDGQPAAIKVAAGLWCAFLGENFVKILDRVILGQSRRGPAENRLNNDDTSESDARALFSPAGPTLELEAHTADLPATEIAKVELESAPLFHQGTGMRSIPVPVGDLRVMPEAVTIQDTDRIPVMRRTVRM